MCVIFICHSLYRWRVFLTNMAISPERAETVILADCALHNFLRNRLPSYTDNLLDKEDEITHKVTPGVWREQVAALQDVGPLHGNTSLGQAKKQREALCLFVNGPGAVPWQDAMVS